MTELERRNVASKKNLDQKKPESSPAPAGKD
jgi:hypothetical protein